MVISLRLLCACLASAHVACFAVIHYDHFRGQRWKTELAALPNRLPRRKLVVRPEIRSPHSRVQASASIAKFKDVMKEKNSRLKEVKRTKLLASVQELGESLEALMKKRIEILQNDMQKLDVALAKALQNKDVSLAAMIREYRRDTASTIANLNLCTAESIGDQISHRIAMGKDINRMPKEKRKNEKAELAAMVKDRKREVTIATQSLAVHLSNVTGETVETSTTNGKLDLDVVCRVLLESLATEQPHPRGKTTMIELGEGDVTSPKTMQLTSEISADQNNRPQDEEPESWQPPRWYREQSRGSALGLNDRIMPTDQFLFMVYNVVSVKLLDLMLFDLE
jgi:hypothetical protein